MYLLSQVRYSCKVCLYLQRYAIGKVKSLICVCIYTHIAQVYVIYIALGAKSHTSNQGSLMPNENTYIYRDTIIVMIYIYINLFVYYPNYIAALTGRPLVNKTPYAKKYIDASLQNTSLL